MFQCVWHIEKYPFWAVTTKNTTPKQKNNSSTITQKRTHPRCNFCKIWSYTFSRTISIQNSNPEEKICDELCIYNCQLRKKDFKTYNIWCVFGFNENQSFKKLYCMPYVFQCSKHQKHNFLRLLSKHVILLINPCWTFVKMQSDQFIKTGKYTFGSPFYSCTTIIIFSNEACKS